MTPFALKIALIAGPVALLLAYEIKRHWREFMDHMQRQAKDMDR